MAKPKTKIQKLPKPKYTLGDIVWYMNNNYPQSGRVVNVSAQLDEDYNWTRVEYKVKCVYNDGSSSNSPYDYSGNEKRFYLTKQALLETL